MTTVYAANHDDPIRIRASSTTMWPDCERRGAANSYRKLVEDKGFLLRTTAISIGAPIGSAVHAGAAHAMRFKIEHDRLPKFDEAMEVADASLKDELGKREVNWDATAPSRKGAQEQTGRMLRIVHFQLAPDVQPAAVEDHLVADIGHNFVLSGHRDIYAVVVQNGRWWIIDLKTGMFVGLHVPQVGSYSLLGRTHGNPVDRLSIFYVPRVSLKKTQPAGVFLEVPVDVAERAAEARYTRMKAQLQRFMETGDEQVFAANPFSKLCSEKSCSAWGTDFCREHPPELKED